MWQQMPEAAQTVHAAFHPMPLFSPMFIFPHCPAFQHMPLSPLIWTFAPMEIDYCPGIGSFVDLFASKNFRISLVEDHQFCKFLHEAKPHIKCPLLRSSTLR
jgi:hypothetical protein